MGKPTRAKYGLEELHLYSYFQTREEYNKFTGEEPPTWDPLKPPKYCYDAKALGSSRRNVVYDQVLAVSEENGMAKIGLDGKPYFEIMVLPKEEAARVNIPPKGPGVSNVPGADQPEVPVPLRPLEADEEMFFDFGGVVAVRNKSMYPLIAVGFTAEDRQLLQRIGAKLGVG